MKKFLLFMLAVVCVFVLLGCERALLDGHSSPSTEKGTEVSSELPSTDGGTEEHNGLTHVWQRIENANEYTAVEQCSICGIARTYTDSDAITPSGTETGVKLYRRAWFGTYLDRKDIDTCDLGYAIVDCLVGLQETGEVVPQISEEEIDWESNSPFYGLPIESGTLWIDCKSAGLFRLNPEMTEICKVETHLGEGTALAMTDTMETLLQQAWYYYPYDYWSGKYDNGEFSLQQVYKCDSAVESVIIDAMHIENVHDSQNNRLTLRIRAQENKTVRASLMSYQSDDNLCGFDEKTLDLMAGEETTAEFVFAGFYGHTYFATITIDNTKIHLTIKPQETD